MRHDVIELNVPAAIATGTAAVVDRFREKWVQVHGTFSATVQLQGKIGPHADWQDVGTAASAPAFIEVPQALTHLRVKTTAYTSGTPAATFGGRDSRSM